jgi:hypothetical protein
MSIYYDDKMEDQLYFSDHIAFQVSGVHLMETVISSDILILPRSVIVMYILYW